MALSGRKTTGKDPREEGGKTAEEEESEGVSFKKKSGSL